VRASLPSELLVKLIHATPEQLAAVERMLMLSAEAPEQNSSAKLGDIHAMFCELRKEIAAIRSDYHELRRTKEELAKMRAEGLFKFVEKIDPDSFRLLFAILLHGDVAKASRALGEKDSTVRTRLADWKRRGPAYRVLLELVRWRKAIGRKEPVQISEEILRGSAARGDFEGLISDVLDELLSFDQSNWESKCEELATLLRPYVRS
jgi:hypothetical protein